MVRLLFLIMISLFLLSGFSHQNHLKLIDVDTTIIVPEKIIRYDLKIKNTGSTTIGTEFDYPGYKYTGIEVVVVPNKKLEQFMKMLPNTKYKKMKPAGFGGTGRIPPDKIGDFHAEYIYKHKSDSDKIKKMALNAKIIVLDGTNVIAELPLK
ncbi:hypothetical protein ACFO3D_17670 [Virgibacillus kekensis]|uniref:Uncharacterized protein n=1 Tax=Virgibacillus kekensis TaxID=202261 RepID=A0ABV9DQY9_9BACI